MKNHLLLIALVFVIVFSCSAQIVKQTKLKPNEKLTAWDRKNYILSIDAKMIRSFDTMYRDIPYADHESLVHCLSVPVKLTNNSSDVLKYVTMSCSWFEYYTTNNDGLHVVYWGCDKNIPNDVAVAPHTSNTVWLSLYYTEKAVKKDNFCIGMTLQKYKPDSFPMQFNNPRKDKQDVIWSNTITIPKH